MKRLLLLNIFIASFVLVYAQPSRVGQAGATQLLMNSYSRSTGFNGANIGSVSGIEASSINPAGIATTRKTELVFSNCQWMIGSQIGVNSFGFSQRLGETGGVLGIAVNALSLGDFVRTTVAQPDGTLGNFRPSFANIGLSYAKQFTDHIYVGATIRVISESMDQVSAQGVAFDAGVQYRTGPDEHPEKVKFGVALRNVGGQMRYNGDGLFNRVYLNPANPYTSAVQIPADKFELPSVLSIGGSYDMYFGEKNTFSLVGSFISNSFYFNQIGAAAEYKYRNIFMLRGGFMYEKGIFGQLGVDRFSAYTGPCAGMTFQIPVKTGKLNDDGKEIFSNFAIDASYRSTNPFGGTLCVGARIDL